MFWSGSHFGIAFETTVHNNPTLSGVQKLNYLHALLQGGALHVIAGLSFTNASFSHSVTQLHDRYEQTHKLISAHMKSVIELTTLSPHYSCHMMQWRPTLVPLYHLASLLPNMGQC